MSRNQNVAPLFGVFREILTDYMKNVYTCIPAHVKTFDPATQLAQIELGIKRVDIDGSSVAPPPIIDCPVLMIGDQFMLETQIDPEAEGMAFFSQRCIDGWVNTGGVAENPLTRFFDMQDAFFIAGFRPMPKAIPDFQNNGMRLRNRKGDQWVWLKNDGSIFIENGKGHIRMDAGGTVTINGVKIDTASNVTSPATITGNTDVVAAGISGKGHTHGGVQGGSSSTGKPQ